MGLNFISSNKAFDQTVANDESVKNIENDILNAIKNRRYYIECRHLSIYQVHLLLDLGYKVEKAFLYDEGGFMYRGYVVSWNKVLKKAEAKSNERENPVVWW